MYTSLTARTLTTVVDLGVESLWKTQRIGHLGNGGNDRENEKHVQPTGKTLSIFQ